MQNNQKCFMHWPLVITKIYNFGPILDQCWSKNFKTKLFPLQFYFLCYCNYMQKTGNLHALTFKNTWKTSFWAHFKFQNNVIPNKIICVTFKSLCCCNFMQKIRKLSFTELTFDNTCKTSFGDHFGPHLTQKPQKNIFSKKKIILVNFMLRCYYVLIYLLLL